MATVKHRSPGKFALQLHSVVQNDKDGQSNSCVVQLPLLGLYVEVPCMFSNCWIT